MISKFLLRLVYFRSYLGLKSSYLVAFSLSFFFFSFIGYRVTNGFGHHATPGPDPMNGLQACIHNLLKLTCSFEGSQVFFATRSINPRTYFCIHVFYLTLSQMAWLEFLSPNSYSVIGNQTHVGSVVPPRGTFIHYALPTELPRSAAAREVKFNWPMFVS